MAGREREREEECLYVCVCVCVCVCALVSFANFRNAICADINIKVNMTTFLLPDKRAPQSKCYATHTVVVR